MEGLRRRVTSLAWGKAESVSFFVCLSCHGRVDFGPDRNLKESRCQLPQWGWDYSLWVYLCCCCSASSMQWMRHYLLGYSCSRWIHCCSPLNSAQSGGKHGHAYLAGWPKLRLPPHSAAGRRRKRCGGGPSPPRMRCHGTAGHGSSEGSCGYREEWFSSYYDA